MKIEEKLTYTNERGESIVFSPASVYHVNMHDVSGLSDVRTTLYSSSSMRQDGSTFLGSRIETRDIDFAGSIKARGKQTVHELRRDMNRILNPQYRATLTYELGDMVRVIDCHIDSAPIFTRGQIFTKFSIRLDCLNPFWREAQEARADIAAWIGGFEFPEPDGLKLTDDWEIGYRQPELIVDANNSGDVKSGIRVEFRALGSIKNPMLLNVNTQEFLKFNIDMIGGDMLTVKTGYGEKSAVLTRNGVTTNAFRSIDVDSTYIQLAAGENLFTYDADENPDNLEVTIYHSNLYLGV